MTDSNVFQLSQPGTFSDPLTEVLRSGARALLAQAVAAEVAGFLDGHADKLTDDGRQRLVRHGHLPEREIMTGIGPVAVRAPRIRDRVGTGEERIAFSSAILPPYARRSKSLEVLIPILYLKSLPLRRQGHLHRRVRGGAGSAARQGCWWALGLDHRTAQGGLGGRAHALAEAGSVSQALRLFLGRRYPRASPARERCAVPARDHRRKVHRRHRSRQPTAASRLTPTVTNIPQ
jgi:hypothetical protein